jgi:hypothetical protein
MATNGRERLIGPTKGGAHPKLNAVTVGNGRPISDFTGEAALLDNLPKAQWVLADRCPRTFFSAVALAPTVIFWL